MSISTADRNSNNQIASAAYRFSCGQEASYTKVRWAIANEVGIAEALLMQVVEDWCQSNRRKNKRGYFHDNEWWTAGTYRQWAQNYPALGKIKTLQRLFLQLEKEEYILSMQPYKIRGNSIKFYRVNAEKVGTLLLKAPYVTENDEDDFDTDPTDFYADPNLGDPLGNGSGGGRSNLGESRLETHTEQEFQPPNKIYTNIQPKQITQEGLGLKKEKEVTSYQDPIVQNPLPVNKEIQDLATTSTSTHEDTLCEAARENNSQNSTEISTVNTTNENTNCSAIYTEECIVNENTATSTVEVTENSSVVEATAPLTFSADPLKEVNFLAYFKARIKRSRDVVIEKIHAYVSKMLSNTSEGAAEVLAAFNEWKKDCAALGRKISDVSESDLITQKEKYNFESWDRDRNRIYFSRLLNEGFERFFTHELSKLWYEWAIVRHAHVFAGVEVPA